MSESLLLRPILCAQVVLGGAREGWQLPAHCAAGSFLEAEVALQGCRFPAPHNHPGLRARNIPSAVSGDELLLLSPKTASQLSLRWF